MITRDGVTRLAGHIVHDGTAYVFKSKKGQIFDVVLDFDVERLVKTHELCIFEEIPNKNPKATRYGKVVKIIGKGGDPIPEGRAIAEVYNLINDEPFEVEEEVKKVPTYVRPSDGKDFADLRDIPFVTIDPDSAKDYDDAVYAKRNPDGSYELKVAIANVSKYVPVDSKLYNYATDNGNSKYLGDMVYPMLPEKLSNGICSLNEGVNRLTMCTTCIINPDGTLRSYKIEPALIQSRHRLTYKEADYIHFGKNAEGDTDEHKGLLIKTIDVRDSLDSLLEVANILFDARMKRGSFDIGNREFDFKFDDTKTEVLGYQRSHNEVYTSVIEETAIITNEIWGEVAKNLGIPFDYRNHELIDDEDIASELQDKLRQFNIKLPKNYSGKNIQKIINSVKGKRIEEYVIKSILSSMRPATYSSENYGHVGLGIRSDKNPVKEYINYKAEINKARTNYLNSSLGGGTPYGLLFEGDISHSAYGHTTSPIRRSSDLINQIQFMSIIMDNKIRFSDEYIEDMSDSFNFNEKNSKMAEKEYNEMLFALWASKNIGMTFENCIVVDKGNYEAFLMSPEGVRFLLPYNSLDFPRKYLKIGKEIESVTIKNVSLYPPRISVEPTPSMKFDNDNVLEEKEC